jgi:hypothetical protein
MLGERRRTYSGSRSGRAPPLAMGDELTTSAETQGSGHNIPSSIHGILRAHNRSSSFGAGGSPSHSPSISQLKHNGHHSAPSASKQLQYRHPPATSLIPKDPHRQRHHPPVRSRLEFESSPVGAWNDYRGFVWG